MDKLYNSKLFYLLLILTILIIFLLIYIFYLLYDNNKISDEDNQILDNNINILPENIKENVFDDYKILEIYNILTPEECKLLINMAKDSGLKNSEVFSYNKKSFTEVNNNYRTSDQVWLPDKEHSITMKIARICEKITGISKNHQERLQVAHYNKNGKFEEHYDVCIHDDMEYCKQINHNAGQRCATLLIYLNDDFENGETEFVNLKFKIKPEIGKGILFWNVDDKDNVLLKSLHKGNIVTNGEKWIATKWTHTKLYN
jgi:prolyl 4-hydroxylase